MDPLYGAVEDCGQSIERNCPTPIGSSLSCRSFPIVLVGGPQKATPQSLRSPMGLTEEIFAVRDCRVTAHSPTSMVQLGRERDEIGPARQWDSAFVTCSQHNARRGPPRLFVFDREKTDDILPRHSLSSPTNLHPRVQRQKR